CRVFSIDSINRHAWMNDSVSIPEKARRQALYASYIEEEVVPFIRTACGGASWIRLGASGASFGAFHAANQFFRRQDLFDTLIAMSGFYDLEPTYTHGYRDDNTYYNNPVAYLANVHDDWTLDKLRHSSIHILSGRGAHEAPHRSEQLSHVLNDKGVPH